MSEKPNNFILDIESMMARTPPSILALFLQFLSLFLCFFAVIFIETQFPFDVPLYVSLFFQAALAAFFSFLLRMDWWWCIIQFFFPILIIVFGFVKIMPLYYLAAFILFALVYWSSFRTRVPYFPSKPSLLPALLDLLSTEDSIKFIDVGSGLGGLIIELSNAIEKSHFSGIEIAPLPWMISFLRGKFCKSDARFLFGNYEKLHLGDYDVVFAYLSPAAMPELWKKAKREMRSGAIFLSYEFIIPNVEPDFSINMDPNDPTLYLWRI